MPTWLDAIMSPLNAAGEGLEKLIETRDLIKFGDELRKLYTEILAAQRGAMTAQANEAALLEEVGALKRHVAQLEQLNAEKYMYELVALAPNVVAYARRQAERDSVLPPHYLCANCFVKGVKSFLNQYVRGNYVDKYRCNGCGEDLTVDKGTPPQRTSWNPRGGGPQGWMG